MHHATVLFCRTDDKMYAKLCNTAWNIATIMIIIESPSHTHTTIYPHVLLPQSHSRRDWKLYLNGIMMKMGLIFMPPNVMYNHLQWWIEMKCLSNGGTLAINQPWEKLFREIWWPLKSLYQRECLLIWCVRSTPKTCGKCVCSRNQLQCETLGRSFIRTKFQHLYWSGVVESLGKSFKCVGLSFSACQMGLTGSFPQISGDM